MNTKIKTVTFEQIMSNEGYGIAGEKYFGFFKEGTNSGKLIRLFYENKKTSITKQYILDKIPDVEGIDTLLSELEDNCIIGKSDNEEVTYYFNHAEYERLKNSIKELFTT